MIVAASRNLGKRSTNPNNLTLAKDITLMPMQLGGMGFTFPAPESAVGYLGYAAAAVLGYYLLFGGSRAKERRAALKTAREHYDQERRSVYQKFGRI